MDDSFNHFETNSHKMHWFIPVISSPQVFKSQKAIPLPRLYTEDTEVDFAFRSNLTQQVK